MIQCKGNLCGTSFHGMSLCMEYMNIKAYEMYRIAKNALET
jgi:hypothetical protein